MLAFEHQQAHNFIPAVSVGATTEVACVVNRRRNFVMNTPIGDDGQSASALRAQLSNAVARAAKAQRRAVRAQQRAALLAAHVERLRARLASLPDAASLPSAADAGAGADASALLPLSATTSASASARASSPCDGDDGDLVSDSDILPHTAPTAGSTPRRLRGIPRRISLPTNSASGFDQRDSQPQSQQLSLFNHPSHKLRSRNKPHLARKALEPPPFLANGNPNTELCVSYIELLGARFPVLKQVNPANRNRKIIDAMTTRFHTENQISHAVVHSDSGHPVMAIPSALQNSYSRYILDNRQARVFLYDSDDSEPMAAVSERSVNLEPAFGDVIPNFPTAAPSTLLDGTPNTLKYRVWVEILTLKYPACPWKVDRALYQVLVEACRRFCDRNNLRARLPHPANKKASMCIPEALVPKFFEAMDAVFKRRRIIAANNGNVGGNAQKLVKTSYEKRPDDRRAAEDPDKMDAEIFDDADDRRLALPPVDPRILEATDCEIIIQAILPDTQLSQSHKDAILVGVNLFLESEMPNSEDYVIRDASDAIRKIYIPNNITSDFSEWLYYELMRVFPDERHVQFH
ncbi:hypothetical protein HDU84_007264 [Entophlyctis sp. JEL0112]|nr:hypothetical protein HDU84_007264 [Entophlyctis sp. JEL0112]